MTVTDPGAVVGLGLQLGDLGDLLEEVGLLHPGLGAAPLELRPRVPQDHLEVHRETWREEERWSQCGLNAHSDFIIVAADGEGAHSCI